MTDAEEIYYAAYAKRAFHEMFGGATEGQLLEIDAALDGGDGRKVAGLLDTLGGVGKALFVDPFVGAAEGFSNFYTNARQGNWGAAGKGLMGGLGNAALGAMIFVPGVGWVGRGVAAGAKAGLGGAKGLMAAKRVHATARAAGQPLVGKANTARYGLYRLGRGLQHGSKKVPMPRGKLVFPAVLGGSFALGTGLSSNKTQTPARLSYGDGGISNSTHPGSQLGTPGGGMQFRKKGL